MQETIIDMLSAIMRTSYTMKKVLFILTIFALNSCAYKMTTFETADGKKVKMKIYKDDNRQEEYVNEVVFNRLYKKMSFEKYKGKIIKDTFNEYTYFQFDTVRIYLNSLQVDGNIGLRYSLLFGSGLITPNIILCALDSLCKQQPDYTEKYNMNHDTLTTDGVVLFDKSFLQKKYNWTGHRIYISKITELVYLEKQSRTKVFELEHKIYYGGPTDAYYYIELTNESANKQTTFDEFIKGAKLTFIKHSRTVAEI